MIAYVDSSVLLRVVLGQTGRLKEWKKLTLGVASGLVEVECLRALDRLRLEHGLADDQLASRREAVYRMVVELELIEPTSIVLRRAAQPLPTPLGTLDAVHLATASLWRELKGQDLFMATHDRALATAARATGLRVLGM